MAPLVHLAVAQLKPRKADYAANLERLGQLFAQLDSADPRPDVLCLPETALTGYFLEGGVRDVALTAGELARDLQRTYAAHATSGRPMDVMVGFYELWQHKLYNSALYATLGAAGDDDGDGGAVVHHVHRKVFLPTYGLFDEERFVERGRDVRAFATPWGRAAILVCEDLWHSVTATVAALDGAQVVFVPTAPPARGPWPREDGVPGPASAARWERLASYVADEHGIFVVLAHLVGSEGGKTFPGGSMVAGPKGEVVGRAPVWEEAVLSVTLDLRDVTRARADMPLIADLETMMPHLRASLERVEAGVPGELAYDPAPRGAPPHNHDRPSRAESRNHSTATAPFRVVTAAHHGLTPPHPLDIDPELVEEWLVHFIRDELQRRGFTDAIVGLSGGVDSAVTAALAARALGAEHVLGVRLPYRTSSSGSLEHAQQVADSLGIRCRTLDISAAVDGYLANEPEADGARRGNVMARMRMIALFDLSAKHRALPLGTGNKTERLFGYFTWHADDSPPVNPLGDLFKTQVWTLARHLGIPGAVISKPPSADLIEGQTDEGDFGISYAKADELLNWLLSGYTEADLLERGFPEAEVRLVRDRLESTHWKRRLPTVAVLSSTAIGESYLRPVDY